ncbi:putative ribosomal protein S7 [Rosa chinensis]|uniref:Putative ribosomal protein S7 n=1 Tax=Rosa chinensis TaxID=74649 RepID=A0A2P6RDJ8_ROSCH|nr:putative ribosomal protein S7 [Rosa chinensis]
MLLLLLLLLLPEKVFDFYAVFFCRGDAIRKKEGTHRMAEANS